MTIGILQNLASGLIVLFAAMECRHLLVFFSRTGDARDRAFVRPLAFLLFMATDLSLSFMPLVLADSGQPFLGLTGARLAGLPISVEMLCAALSSLASGHLIDGKGWRCSFTAGAALLLAGAAGSALSAGSPALFVASRGLSGLGYGLAWMGLRGYVATWTSEKDQARGFAQLNAGIYSGSICACALGGKLASPLGFSGVFAVSACVVLAASAFSALGGKRPTPPTAPFTLSNLTAYWTDMRVLSLCFLITIPATLCVAGFMNYHLPLLAARDGLPPSITGSVFMLYGLCIVQAGPLAGRLIARQGTAIRTFITAGGLLGSASLLFYSSTGTMGAAAAVVILLGLSDSLGFVSQNTWLLGLPSTVRLGRGKALAMFSMTKKLGQMLGPMVFGWALAPGGVSGLAIVAGVSLLLVAAFALIPVFLARSDSSVSGIMAGDESRSG